MRKNELELEKQRDERLQYVQSLHSLEIPDRYMDADTLEWLFEAIQNKRASTEQEAYNLYEEELKHLQQLSLLSNEIESVKQAIRKL